MSSSIDNDGVQVSIVGGVTRVQHGAEEVQETQPTGPTSRVHSGSLSMNLATGEVREQGVSSVNAADFHRPNGFGLLATARTAFGSPAQTLTSETIVTSPDGVEMKLAQAEMANLVKRDANGRYVEIGPEERAARDQAAQLRVESRQPEAQEGDIRAMKQEAFPPELETALAKMVEGVPQQIVNEVLTDAAFLLAKNGSLDALNIESVASKTGLTPEDAAQFMGASLTALSAQVDRVLLQQQIDPSQFAQWAVRERAEQFKRAMVYHVGVRDLSGYRALAKDFIRNCYPTAEGLRQAGFEAMVDPSSKDLLVKWQGAWTSARALALQGLI